MSDTEGEIPPVHTTEQEAEPEVTPPPEPEKKGMATTTSKETNLSGLSTYQKLLSEETGWQPKFRISPADAAGIEASKSVKAVRDKAYTGDNYKGLTIKVPDLKTVGWEKWSTNLKATWRQLEIMDVALGFTRKPVPVGETPTEQERTEILCWQRIDYTARYYLEQSLSKEYLHIVRGTTTTAGAYGALSAHFGWDTQMAIPHALHALNKNRWVPNQGVSMTENISWIHGQCSYLREFPDSLDELVDVIEAMYILASTPPEWDVVKDILHSKRKVRLDAVTRLCALKDNPEGRDSENPNLAIAALHTRGKPKEKKGSTKCENCKKKGHAKKDCWAKGGGKEGQGPKQKGSKPKEDSKKKTYALSADVDERSDTDESVYVAHVLSRKFQESLATTESDAESDWLPFPRKGEFTSGYSSKGESESDPEPEPDKEDISVVTVASASENTERWLFDSAASASLTSNKELLRDYHEITPIAVGGFGSGMTAYAVGKGNVVLKFPAPKESKYEEVALTVGNVLLIREANCNIISAARLMSQNISIAGTGNEITLSTKNICLGRAIARNGQFFLQTRHSKGSQRIDAAINAVTIPLMEWHRRFGHLNSRYLELLSKKGLVEGLGPIAKQGITCKTCPIGKGTRQSFPKSKSKAKKAFELIHSDLSGPMRTLSRQGFSYVHSITDDKTRFSFVYLLKGKDDAYKIFEKFFPLVATQFNSKVVRLRTDQGGEFLNDRLKRFLADHGIIHETTNAYTPQQNGVAERLNRTLADKVRCIYYENPKIPPNLWVEVYEHANYLRNISPTKSNKNGKTPWQALYRKKADVSNLRPFWEPVIIHIPSEKQDGKFSARGFEAHFIGFEPGIKGIKYYIPGTRQISTSRDYVFPRDPTIPLDRDDPDNDEHTAIEGGSTSDANPPVNNGSESVKETPPAPAPNEEGAPRKRKYVRKDYGPPSRASTRTSNKTTRFIDSQEQQKKPPKRQQQQQQQQQLQQEKLHENPIDSESPTETDDTPDVQEEHRQEEGTENSIVHYVFANAVVDDRDPIDFQEAVSGPDADLWIDSMNRELDNLKRLNVYDLVPLPKGRKAVGSKWIYKVKRDADSKPKEHKSRLVAQGFTQKYLIDYKQVHAPVARTSSFKLLATIAAYLGLTAHQLDVKAAFLNGELEEEIFMRQPPGFAEKGKEDYVYRLKKSIYGLKQSGRVWNRRFDKELRALGYTRLKSDPCVYIRQDKDGITMLAIHVDDLEFFTPSDKYVTELIRDLAKKDIELVHIGPLKYMLGVNFSFDLPNRSVLLNQHGYIDVLLDRFDMSEAKPAPTPFPSGTKLTKDDCPTDNEARKEMERYPFHALIGSLLYLTIWTRPDIAYHVNALAQFTSNPGYHHWKLGTHILRYLKGTRDLCLTLSASEFPFKVTGYADADWGSSEGRKSTTGYAFTLGSGAFTWQSKKQPTVALSSAEAEYMALSAATQECLWLRTILSELGYSQQEPTFIYSDNLGAISLTSDSVLHQRVKHIDIRHHFIRDHVENGDVKAEYLRTEDQPADALTKLLTAVLHSRHATTLGLSRP